MAGHSRWKTLRAKRLAEAGDVAEHPDYEQAGRDLSECLINDLMSRGRGVVPGWCRGGCAEMGGRGPCVF